MFEDHITRERRMGQEEEMSLVAFIIFWVIIVLVTAIVIGEVTGLTDLIIISAGTSFN